MSLSHYQSHVWVDYVGDIIVRLIFPLQQHSCFLPTLVGNVNLHHVVQST